MNKKYFLDIAHMHPICPLSLSHARIFVLADVFARWKRKQGFSVRFPICMHYSGSTVFKITNAVSNFLKKQSLSDTDQKTLDLIFNFYRIPKEHLHKLTDPLTVLDYFSDVILKDLKNIQISCDYDYYFNTQHPLYHDFVKAVFEFYKEKKFIKIHSNNKSLDYSNPFFKNLAIKRLNETKFLPITAKNMILDSIKKLNNGWAFERINSIGTNINGRIIDSMFDSEFLSIFNALYPYLKNLKEINNTNTLDIFKDILYKIDGQNKQVSSIAEKLYLDLQNILPVDRFIVERHLQSWIAKKIYTETILSPTKPLTYEYFFLGSITQNGQVNSASRGRGMTLSQLIETIGPINARILLLYTFTYPWKDHEINSTLLTQIRKKTYKFLNFMKLLQIRSVEKNFAKIKSILNQAEQDIYKYISQGSTRQIIDLLFDKLPKIIYPLTDWSRNNIINEKIEILNFFLYYLDILCPGLKEKIYET